MPSPVDLNRGADDGLGIGETRVPCLSNACHAIARRNVTSTKPSPRYPGLTLYCAELGIALVGDALFAGSVGRVDFPNSDGAALMRNIKEHLMTLPGETRVLSGHGPETTIEKERTTNPFVLHGI